MSGMRLDGEETVILLSNLLDNAIMLCLCGLPRAGAALNDRGAAEKNELTLEKQ